MRRLADALALDTGEARIFMITGRDGKPPHFEGGVRPMLFDLGNQPGELVHLGGAPR